MPGSLHRKPPGIYFILYQTFHPENDTGLYNGMNE